jgi:HEAT repeat protein
MRCTLSFIVSAALLTTAVPAFAIPQQAPASTPAQSTAPVAKTPPTSAQVPANGAKESSRAQESTKIPDAELPHTARAWLIAGASSDSARDRSDTISALTILLNDPEAIGLIESGLEDRDVSIRVLAVTSLGSMKARMAIPRLRKALDDDSAQVDFAAAQALWGMGDQSGRDVLYQVLDGSRKAGPGLIQGKINDAKQDIHNPKKLAMMGVNQASGAFLGPFSIGVYFAEEYAKHNSAPAQAVCAKLLSSDRTEETVAELVGALGDSSWVVRAAAARALGEMDRPEALPGLKAELENDDQSTAQFAAAAAIVRITRSYRVRHETRPALLSQSGMANKSE